MDRILQQLQGKAFHLSADILRFLSDRYENLLAEPLPDTDIRDFHPVFFSRIINLHRKQFQTNKYIQSRILNPTTGTIDHIHSEITASTAVRIGSETGYSGYALQLLRTAGHMHDSDRSFPGTMIGGEQEVRKDPAGYRKYKEKHAANSALMALNMVKAAGEEGFGCPSGFLNDLRYLILRHELGGVKHNGDHSGKRSAVDESLDIDLLTDIVTDADSLSYFETNILTNWEESDRSEIALANKVHFMFDRMSVHARTAMLETILFSREHILGVNETNDDDVNAIRSILLKECH